MGAHHPRHSSAPGTKQMQRLAAMVIVPIAVITLVGLVLMWPTDDVAGPEALAGGDEFQGQVTAIHQEACAESIPDDVNGCGFAEVRLAEADRGERVIETILPSGPGAPEIDEGDGVVLIKTSSPDGETYSIVDHTRGTQLWVLLGAFALALVAFGRWRGLTAIVGLVVAFGILVFFVVPAILGGQPPLLVAIVGSAAIMLTVLYLTHGLALSTSVALLGTLVSLGLTAALSALAVAGLHLSGITDDLSTSVGTTHRVNMEGLLLAGIVIGSLGVLDDVTVTQASTVDELARANPAYGVRDLYRAGSRVGRSHIASVVNTIILAYAGSSLPLMILIVAAQEPLGGVLTDQVIAQEIVRSVVATLGLVAAVPITTGLAAFAATKVAGRAD
jgi:uncharacterized membrane protein